VRGRRSPYTAKNRELPRLSLCRRRSAVPTAVDPSSVSSSSRRRCRRPPPQVRPSPASLSPLPRSSIRRRSSPRPPSTPATMLPPLALSPLTSPADGALPCPQSRRRANTSRSPAGAVAGATAAVQDGGRRRRTGPSAVRTSGLASEDDDAQPRTVRHPSEPLLVHGNHQGRRRRASSGTPVAPADWRGHLGPWTRPCAPDGALPRPARPKPHFHAAVQEPPKGRNLRLSC
jgi:hypothetical protein